MQNGEIAGLFLELADLLEIQGSNPFRIRAYRNAARTIENETESFDLIVKNSPEELQSFSGIGKDLAEKIVHVVETGSFSQLEELRNEIPVGVVQMLRLPGIGPKKVGAMYRELSLTTIDELKAAAEQGQISELKGFAKKTEESILKGIEHLAEMGNRALLAEAKAQADLIVEDLSQLDSVQNISVAGSCRRRKETVGDLDLLISSENSEEAMETLKEHPLVSEVLQQGKTKQRVRLNTGLEMDLRVVPEDSYGAAMQYFTGSKEHNIVMRKKAQERGWKLNEYGLFEGEKQIAGTSEEEIYTQLGLEWIPPELREDRGEFEASEKGTLPKLIELKDIRADLHMHTTASDGTASIKEMAEAAKKLGWKYISITDHSKRVTMANGLDEKRLRKHWENIRKVQEEIKGIDILCGIECDILEDGTMDLSEEVLLEADWVVAVLHYGLKQPKEKINERLLNAIRCPAVTAIGHLTGRLVNRRKGADMDVDDIFKAASDYGVMMEINAHPKRLDLNDLHARKARDMGIPIVINTDAHSTNGFDVMQYGIFQARRAGLEKKDVANTRTLKQFRKMLRTSR
jgi:DNA polymerase (family X)